ncbi:MAG: peptidylprolyl isomerase, partial [Chitinophagaceae bacterium]
YPFENAVYNTPVGKVSKPFRTQFGYHIIKVIDRRPTRGEVQVAHILIATPKSKGDLIYNDAKKKADSVELLLKQGVPFDSLVHRFSDDKLSVANNGVLAPFGAGRMVPSFENAAFALKKVGDVSAPIQTEYGYHIIKLLKKIPLQSFDSLLPMLKRRIDNDSRSQIAQTEFMNKIKKAHGFKEFPAALDEVITKIKALPDTGAEANVLRASDFRRMSQPMFELDGHKYLQSDFFSYAENLTHGRLNGPREAVTRDIYKMYVDKTVTDFEEHSLADKNPDFKNLMEEYRDGIMIFELMDRNVWGKATKDSVGLKAFYEAHKDHYQWEPGFTGDVYRFKDNATMTKGLALLQKGKKEEDLNKELNIEQVPDAFSVQKGHYEFSRFKEVPQSDIVAGKPSRAVHNVDGTYTVVVADKVYTQPSQKSLDEARGYVSAEYQDELEKTWSAQLRAKYPVKLDEKVFKSMVK